ncbi:MAG: DUF4392 domain-containing protein [Clostridia bacterium]|nr:DUF4392 domain-containing protein [Clostridia bacterium]
MSIEDIVLRHSGRGMDILRPHLPPDFIEQTADKLLALERKNILLTTGFYVAGYAETDGPPGTLFLAKALQALGFSPLILTDSFCRGFFEESGIPIRYLEKGFDAKAILADYAPVCLISIERCGENIQNDYANMRDVSIAEHTVEIDKLFDEALRQGVYTIGIGDGGNEIGMGNVKDIITTDLSLTPCRTEVTDLLIASVSNWGAYGLTAALSVKTGTNLFDDYKTVDDYIKYIVSKGSVDGVNKTHVPTVDGYEPAVEQEIVDRLNAYIKSHI